MRVVGTAGDGTARHERGGARGRGTARETAAGPTWTRDDAVAAEHRRLAVAHRAASTALSLAESSACVGLTEADRDESPLEHAADIARVTPLVEHYGGKAGGSDVTVGAVVVVRALPGLTAEWLQRLVNCHLARNAALGHDVPEMPTCPLVPRGASATVSSTGDGFAVSIRGDDKNAAEEILARAQMLVAHTGASGG